MIQRMTDWGDTVSWPYYYLYLLFFFGGGRLMTVDSSGTRENKKERIAPAGPVVGTATFCSKDCGSRTSN